VSVHKTPAGTHRVYYREGGKQRSKTFTNKTEANTFDAEIRRKKTEGRPIIRAKDAPILEDFAVQWLARRVDLSEKTLTGYAHALDKHVFPFLGHLRVHASDLRPAVLAQWRDDRVAAGTGKSVLKEARMVLHQILDAAVLPAELLELNPLTSVNTPKPERQAHRYLDAVGVETLRHYFLDKGDPLSAMLTSILAYVGIRPQDVLALEWGHVGEELAVVQKNVDGQILPGSKTGLAYRRKVKVPQAVAAELAEWGDSDFAATSKYLFPRPKDGEPWRGYDYANWRRKFVRGVEAVTVEIGRPYDLRHTCASLMASTGSTHVEIAHQLGHTPETSVRFYQHLIQVGNGPRPTMDQQIEQARSQVLSADDVAE
jgi:integrase